MVFKKMEKKLKQTSLLLVLICGLSLVTFGGQVEYPLVQSISYFPFHNNTPLDKGEISLSLDMNYSNIYMFQWNGNTVNDMEMFSNTLALRYGMSDWLTLELYHRFLLVHGGFLDQFTMDFHETFNLPTDARDVYPIDSVHYSFKDAFNYEDNSSTSSPLVLGAAVDLVDKEHVHLVGRLALGLPLVPKPGFSSDKPFLAAGAAVRLKKGNLYLDLSGYLTFYKAPEWLENESLRYNMFTWEAEAGWGRFFTGFKYRTSPFKEEDLSHHAYQVVIGYRFLRWLSFAVVEDFTPFDTTPDFSFNLRLHLINN